MLLSKSLRSGALIAISIALGPSSVPSSFAAGTDSENHSVVADFLAQYCLQCHDADSAEGERDLASFALPILSEQQLIATDEVIDQVTLKQMPPEDSEQPTDEERLALLSVLRSSNSKALMVAP